MANRNKGEGTIYFSKTRNQWIGQFSKTIAGQKIRKSVYGNTKQEVSEKLLDLRIQMKDIDLIKEKGMPIIQIMDLKEMNQLPIVQLMNAKMEEQAKKQVYLEQLTQKLETIKSEMDITMNRTQTASKEITEKLFQIKENQLNIKEIIKLVKNLPDQLTLQIKIKYIVIGMVISLLLIIIILLIIK